MNIARHVPGIGTRVRVKVPSNVFVCMPVREIRTNDDKYGVGGTIIVNDGIHLEVRWDNGLKCYDPMFDRLEYA